MATFSAIKLKRGGRRTADTLGVEVTGELVQDLEQVPPVAVAAAPPPSRQPPPEDSQPPGEPKTRAGQGKTARTDAPPHPESAPEPPPPNS